MSEGTKLDADDWLGRPLPKRFGVWPGGMPCAITIDPDRRLRPEMLPLEVWTIDGQHLIFHEHRADRHVCRS